MLEDLNEADEFMELLTELGTIQRWIEKDPRLGEKLIAQGEAKGLAEGEAKGKLTALRETTLTLLTQRFGEVPASLKDRIESLDAEQCQELFNRAIHATAIEQLAN